MTSTDIYRNIAARTGGNIYIGVVGPVRTGKSTFIRQVMKHLVLDEIEDPYLLQRTIDELPQASAGRTIMTTEPKFIPENAIEVSLGDHVKCNVRMVDCVGYVVDGALGQQEDDGPRMVLTPWQEQAIPFQQAAEIGTNKVINEHSTINVLITTDGSIGEIGRDAYEPVEERLVHELQKHNKPFIIVLNSMFPDSEQARLLRQHMEEQYGASVLVKNCNELSSQDVDEIISDILLAFPISKINIDLPSWITFLDPADDLKRDLYTHIKECGNRCHTIRQMNDFCALLCDCKNITEAFVEKSDLSNGTVNVKIDVPMALFYEMLSSVLKTKINDDGDLLQQLTMLEQMRREYDKIKKAFQVARERGYGIVQPTKADLVLEKPECYRQGNRFGLRMKASAPTYHIIQTNISSEISPIIGDEEQSKTLQTFMEENLEGNVDKIWDYDIFGKTIYSMVNDGIENKFDSLPDEARFKLQEALTKIMNEGSGGLICIIL